MKMHSIHQEDAQQPEDARVQAFLDIRVPASTPPVGETTLQNEATRLIIRGPASGQHLHAFTLPDSTGQQVQLWQYLQRSNVMLFFHHGVNCPVCEAFLQELATHQETYRQEETAVLAIGPDEPAENSAQPEQPFPLLNDPSGRIISQLGLTAPALVIADRWGEIWAAWLGGDSHQLPSKQDIQQWLSFIEAQCPECTMIEWTD
jgi:peroxiredoxin